MRVLLDCRMSTWSGIGRYCTGLTRALAGLSGIDVVQLIAAGEEPPAPGSPSIEALHHPFSVRGSMEFGRVARDVGPDVVHALHFPVPLPVVHPLIVTIQDLTPLLIPGVMPAAMRRVAYRLKVGHAVHAADRIITPSEHSARDVARFFSRAPGRTTAITLAADDFTSGPVGTLPDWLQGRRYILSMGNTKPHKGLETLLRAFASLADDTLWLVLAGTDPGGFAEAVLGKDPGVSRVRFSGTVTDDSLRALYVGAAVMAFPSLYEGFGLPPLEAMSLGVPVISSRAASLPEVVGDAALTVEPGDTASLAGALERVLSDASLAARLSEAGRRRAASFRWERTAELTAAVYRDAISR